MPSNWLLKKSTGANSETVPAMAAGAAPGGTAAPAGGPAPTPTVAAKPAAETAAVPRSEAEVQRERDTLRRIRQRLADEHVLDLPGSQAEDAARRITIAETAEFGRATRDAVLRAVLQSLRGGFGPLQPYLDNPDVVEIMVNDIQHVYVERRGRLELTPVRFYDDEDVRQLVENAVGRVGRRFDLNEPLVDARLPSGARLNAVRPPLALHGTAVTIRKFPVPFTYQQLVETGAIPDGRDGGFDVAAALRRSVLRRRNIVVSGGTSSGKTTSLNCLTGLIPEHERLIVIEDSAELQPQQEHVVRLESRPRNLEGKGEVTIRDLVRNSLRQRPDRIIVGESRGGEAFDLLVAMNTGHDGSLTTVHSNGPHDTLTRLESMVLMAGLEIPLLAVRTMIASAVQTILHQERSLEPDPDDPATLRVVRRVTHLMAVYGLDPETGRYRTRMLYERPALHRVAGEIEEWERAWYAG